MRLPNAASPTVATVTRRVQASAKATVLLTHRSAITFHKNLAEFDPDQVREPSYAPLRRPDLRRDNATENGCLVDPANVA
jgi:Asp-tRNA(Asn)/Glu-tRNA(Gln) amidotransferase C subunit